MVRAIVESTPAEAAAVAARDFIARLGTTPTAVIGLATGSSPQPFYEALGRLVSAGQLDFSHVHGFALDEYIGLEIDDPRSYHATIARDVVAPLRLNRDKVFTPSGLGTTDEIDEKARLFEEKIAACGGIDLQILGIGANGHVGFNEPGASPSSTTRRVELTPETIAANSRFFDQPGQVPTGAVSQGIATILQARSLVLFANGFAKAAAIRKALDGPVSAACPASYLQNHPDLTVYLDENAAALLSK